MKQFFLVVTLMVTVPFLGGCVVVVHQSPHGHEHVVRTRQVQQQWCTHCNGYGCTTHSHSPYWGARVRVHTGTHHYVPVPTRTYRPVRVRTHRTYVQPTRVYSTRTYVQPTRVHTHRTYVPAAPHRHTVTRQHRTSTYRQTTSSRRSSVSRSRTTTTRRYVPDRQRTTERVKSRASGSSPRKRRR